MCCAVGVGVGVFIGVAGGGTIVGVVGDFAVIVVVGSGGVVVVLLLQLPGGLSERTRAHTS